MLFDRQMQTKDGKHLCPRQTFYGYLSYTVVDIILCTQRISSEGKNSYWCITLHVFWSMKNYSKATSLMNIQLTHMLNKQFDCGETYACTTDLCKYTWRNFHFMVGNNKCNIYTHILRTLNTWILHVSLHLFFIVITSLLQDVFILKLHISWQTLQNMMYINHETINSCRKCKKDIVVWNESQCRCFKIVRKCYVEFLAYLTSSFFFDDKWEQFLTDALFIGHVKPNKSI